MRKILTAAAGVLLCLAPVTSAVLSPAPASAATHWDGVTTHTAAAPVPAATPDFQCPIHVGSFYAFKSSRCDNGSTFSAGCTAGNQGNLMIQPEYASNGCRTRVWIYTALNEKGFALCLHKISATGYLSTDYKSYRIVSNADNC